MPVFDHPGTDSVAFGNQQVMHEVRTHHVELGLRHLGQLSDVLQRGPDPLFQAIECCILGRDADRLRVKVPGFHRLIPQQGPRKGKNSRSASEIEKGLGAGMTKSNHLGQAEMGGGMLARPKAQSRIQLEHHLAGAGSPPTPGRFDQEAGPDFHRAKMTLPGFRPIEGTHLADPDLGCPQMGCLDLDRVPGRLQSLANREDLLLGQLHVHAHR